MVRRLRLRGRFFSILLMPFATASPVPSKAASQGSSSTLSWVMLVLVVDSCRRDGMGAFGALALARHDPILAISDGSRGALEPEPIVCIEPREKRDIRDATEYRE